MYLYHREFKVDKYITLYPLGDWHLGSGQCDEKFIRSHVQRVKNDPTGYGILMGDLTENSIITSAGSVYDQIKDPHSQVNEIVKMLSPIQDKLLFGVESNHSTRTKRAVGLSIDRLICEGLKIPFAGFSCYAYLIIKTKREGSYGYKVYCHHNTGGGISKGGKINAQDKLCKIAPNADCVISGHTHITSRIVEKYKDIYSGKEVTLVDRYRCLYSIGSALDWDDSYAEEKGYSPAVKEFIGIKLFGVINGTCEKTQEYMVFK